MASREAKGETVLVTGASGFIGSTLRRRRRKHWWLACDAEVIICAVMCG